MNNLFDDEEFEDEADDTPEVVTIAPAKKINYLNNKDMLKEIHKSKNSFSEYSDPKYSDYDVIVTNLAEIFFPETQQKAKATRAARMEIGRAHV